MKREVWEAIRPHLGEASAIDFTGGGEPLLHPDLPAWIEEARAAGCEAGLLTNGLLLDRARAKRLMDAGVSWIAVSIDGATRETYERIRRGSDFARICVNMARLRDLRGDDGPLTMVNFVMMDLNLHELEAIVLLVHELGVDQINFKQADVIRGSHGKGHGVFDAKPTREVKAAAKALRRAVRLADSLGLRHTAYSLTPRELPVCGQDPRHSLFVGYDGTVSACINLALGGTTTFLGREVSMPSCRFGRLPGEDLLDVWEGPVCRDHRDRFEARVRHHDEKSYRSLVGGSFADSRRSRREAGEMPEPPEGCKVCHYLHDI